MPPKLPRSGPTRGVVFFDLDDTLYDHRTASRAALRALREEHPSLRRRSLEWLYATYATALETGHRRLMAGRTTPAASRAGRMVEVFGAAGEEISAREAVRRSAIYHAVYRANERAVPGAAGLLGSLRRRHRIGIVSNNRTREQRGKLGRIGLAPYIDLLVTSEMTGCSKPDPRIFAYALRAAGVSAPHAVMVGDSWVADVRGALAAGVGAVWFNRDRRPLPEPVDVGCVERWRPTERAATTIEGRLAGPNPS